MNITQKPASQKQLDFIHSLLVTIDSDNAAEASLAFADSEPTTKSASAYIDTLKAEIAKIKNTEVVKFDVPQGLHLIGQDVYRIRKSKSSGRFYAELLDINAREFRYVGKKPVNDASRDTLMTLDEAKVFGKAYGFCVRCCALLEDPASVEAGVGPVCAKKF